MSCVLVKLGAVFVEEIGIAIICEIHTNGLVKLTPDDVITLHAVRARVYVRPDDVTSTLQYVKNSEKKNSDNLDLWRLQKIAAAVVVVVVVVMATLIMFTLL